ncbi:response regulator [Tenacibaculum finnmarkense]|uniref:LytR/AlgR family response regulator transcription factor n=1 Tax=Tenacibaculum finnmarkense TaxID=2781243 RepID=UPI001EFB4C18|nr:response regulator [Tenacibaculum finnmarkense]MCG8882227.1 response regulator [Tenacibaculum finnmarkense]
MTDKKILIVEDEQIIAENLRYILNEYGYQYVDVAIDAIETFELFKKNSYDLVLMDINLGDLSTLDGIDLVKQLSEKYTFIFMYVTANADKKTVEKAKSTNPSGYIVKPFNNEAIYANVAIALNTLKEELFFLHIEKGMQLKIPLSTITYIKADGAYIHIHCCNEKKYFARKSLSNFDKLHPNFFIRTHKSYLINPFYIKTYTSQTIKIKNQTLPLGRAYKLNFQ